MREESRLDVYLAKKLDISRSKIQKLNKEKKITVDGKNVPDSFRCTVRLPFGKRRYPWKAKTRRFRRRCRS